MLFSNSEKIKSIKKHLKRIFDKDKISFRRVYLLCSSRNGQKKIFSFFIRAIKFVLGIKSESNKIYQQWRITHSPKELDLIQYSKEVEGFEYKPLVSIVLPVYNSNIEYLRATIQSVLNQVYTYWELCVSDDFSSNEEVRTLIKEFAKNDSRIKYVFRSENGHISLNSNSAISISTGEFLAFLDHDDLLSPDAIFQNVKILNQNDNIEFIYSDEDKLDFQGNHIDPYFKSDWCPDSILSRNYICHLLFVKKSLVDSIGGFRVGFEGSQDYDLILRLSEKTQFIYHIPKILYHWRLHQESTAYDKDSKPYAFVSGVKALNDALLRRGLKGGAKLIENTPGFYSIDYHIDSYDKVSIIIPTKNKSDLCDVLLASIFENTDYPDFEVILVDNNSDESSFFECVEKWKKMQPTNFKCIRDEREFNFSRLVNFGVQNSTGKYVLLLNNDTKVIQQNWITRMIQFAQFERIGVVGVKLLYENLTVQHAGVIIGLGGIAGHHHVGKERDDSGYFSYLSSITNYSALTAACILVSKEKYNLVNGFDELLAVEFNDVDFCLKLADKGFDNVYLPDVELIHYESISRGHPYKTKKSYQQHLIDLNLFKSRWQHYIDRDPCYNVNLTKVFDDFRLDMNDEK